MVRKRYVWFINRKRSKKKINIKYKQNTVKVLVTDLNYHILWEVSGVKSDFT